VRSIKKSHLSALLIKETTVSETTVSFAEDYITLNTVSAITAKASPSKQLPNID
jgi:hypothetical protein